MAWITINFRVTPEEYRKFYRRKGEDSWRTLFLTLLKEVEEIEKNSVGIYKEKYGLKGSSKRSGSTASKRSPIKFST